MKNRAKLQARSTSRQYHLSRLFRCVSASRALAIGLHPAGKRGLYQIQPGLVLRFLDAVDDALPYLEETEAGRFEK